MKGNILDGILGLAVGDAFGVPYEFMSRETVRRVIRREMAEGGAHGQPVGTWSDDTSLSLCLLDNLDRNPDYHKIMYSFLIWYEKGEYTAGKECFDIGNSTSRAIKKYKNGVPPLKCGGSGISDNGNGSLMRILPMVYYFDKYREFRLNSRNLELIHKVSALTHAHPIALIACDIYVYLGILLLNGYSLESAYKKSLDEVVEYYGHKGIYAEWLTEFAVVWNLKEKKEAAIKSAGYVIDSLAAAIWALVNSESYESCILKAASLGEDTDTIAAIAGGLAGIYYGYEAIPEMWVRDLRNKQMIFSICRKWNEK